MPKTPFSCRKLTVKKTVSYKNLKPYGFVSCGHPKLAATSSGQPSMLLWSKKDPHSDGVADIDISYNEADEV